MKAITIAVFLLVGIIPAHAQQSATATPRPAPKTKVIPKKVISLDYAHAALLALNYIKNNDAKAQEALDAADAIRSNDEEKLYQSSLGVALDGLHVYSLAWTAKYEYFLAMKMSIFEHPETVDPTIKREFEDSAKKFASNDPYIMERLEHLTACFVSLDNGLRARTKVVDGSACFHLAQ